MTQYSAEWTETIMTIMQKSRRQKMSVFGHITRMGDDRKLKTVMFRAMKGKNKRGKRHREWADDTRTGARTHCRNCTIHGA